METQLPSPEQGADNYTDTSSTARLMDIWTLRVDTTVFKHLKILHKFKLIATINISNISLFNKPSNLMCL